MTMLAAAVVLALAAAIIVLAHQLVAATSALALAADHLRAAVEFAQAAPCIAIGPRVFSVDAASVYLGLSTDDVHALVRGGRLRHVAGDPLRFTKTALDEALDLGLGPRAVSPRGAA